VGKYKANRFATCFVLRLLRMIEGVPRGRQLVRGQRGVTAKTKVANTKRWNSCPPLPVERFRAPRSSGLTSHFITPASRLGHFMISTQQLDLAFDEDSWKSQFNTPTALYRANSLGSYGVTSMGKGFKWDSPESYLEPLPTRRDILEKECSQESVPRRSHSPAIGDRSSLSRAKLQPSVITSSKKTLAPEPYMPTSRPPSRPHSPNTTPSMSNSPRSSVSRNSPLPRPRRRSSQQRVSLIAGRVSIAPLESPSVDNFTPHKLLRTGSTSSFLSAAESIAPPPSAKGEKFLGGRNITEFVIEGEIGRGAYGLVKRGREIMDDGSLGVSIGHCFKCRP
jgi:hypothetical protein